MCPCSYIYTGYSGLYGLYGININRKIRWTGDFVRVMILWIFIGLGSKTVHKYLKMQKKCLFQYLGEEMISEKSPKKAIKMMAL